MKYGVYVVRDLRTGYLTPTIDINDESAKRNFEHAIMQPGTLYYTHASDYQLMVIGEYDSDVGQIICNESTREILLDGKDVQRA